MYPTDGIRSQLEWNSVLSTNSAALPTDQSKHHRKVTLSFPSISSQLNTSLDIHHRHNRYPWRLGISLCFSNHRLGPKVNTVEKLGELRRAGINVGMCVVLTLFFYVFILVVRMNFSYGSYEYHQSVIDNTRKMVARKFHSPFYSDSQLLNDLQSEEPTGRPIAIALDTVSHIYLF